jgi:hypothetical protein
VNKVLSISAEDIDLSVQEREVVSVNDLRPLSVVDHVITVSQYAPKTDSTRPTITPQKNSLLRTVTIHMGVNPDNRPHPHTWGFNLPLAKSKGTGRLGVEFSLPVKDARAFKFGGLLI